MTYTTTNKAFVEPAINDANWGTTLNTMFTAIDAAFGNTTTLSGLTTGTTTLTAAQYGPPIIRLAGTLTGNVIISLPATVGGAWYVYNGCTVGSFTVTFASNGVNGKVLQSGFWSAIICDGTSVDFQSTVVPSAVTSVSGVGAVNGLTLTGTVTSTGDLTLGGSITSVDNSATTNSEIIGYRKIPRSATSGTVAAVDVGKCIAVTAGIALPNNTTTFVAGDSISIYNNTAASITITQGTSITLYLAGTATTGNRTLAQRGIATIWFNSASDAVISGGGLT